MPVELPDLDPPSAPPRSPRAIVWTVLFVFVMVAGVSVALLTRSKDEAAATA